MEIEHNLKDVNNRIKSACERSSRDPDEVMLVAITKTHDAATVRAAFNAGVRHFGENRVQEAGEKLKELEDIRNQVTWHMVGHLQTNKVKTAVELFDIIQSVDSIKLAELLNRNATRQLPVLLEINVAEEGTKSGFEVNELTSALTRIGRLENLEVRGLMTVAPWVDDPEEVRFVFSQLRQLAEAQGLSELSMGMTDDFEVAIEEGATLIRVGRAIFGKRRV